MSTWTARTRLARDRLRPEGFIAPMLAIPSESVPTGPEWQFEVKHDGYRMIGRSDGKPRIWSRWGPPVRSAVGRPLRGRIRLGPRSEA